MTVVTDPYTVLANLIEQTVTTEFSVDHPSMIVSHDHIHESLGSDGRYHVGISPDDEAPNNIDLLIDVKIQFYGPWKKDVDPYQAFDPRLITNKAERLRRALSDVRTVGTTNVWFFDVGRVTYPHDPTGNKTRFEMIITGRGQDSGLLETTG